MVQLAVKITEVVSFHILRSKYFSFDCVFEIILYLCFICLCALWVLCGKNALLVWQGNFRGYNAMHEQYK